MFLFCSLFFKESACIPKEDFDVLIDSLLNIESDS